METTEPRPEGEQPLELLRRRQRRLVAYLLTVSAVGAGWVAGGLLDFPRAGTNMWSLWMIFVGFVGMFIYLPFYWSRLHSLQRASIRGFEVVPPVVPEPRRGLRAEKRFVAGSVSLWVEFSISRGGRRELAIHLLFLTIYSVALVTGIGGGLWFAYRAGPESLAYSAVFALVGISFLVPLRSAILTFTSSRRLVEGQVVAKAAVTNRGIAYVFTEDLVGAVFLDALIRWKTRVGDRTCVIKTFIWPTAGRDPFHLQRIAESVASEPLPPCSDPTHIRYAAQRLAGWAPVDSAGTGQVNGPRPLP